MLFTARMKSSFSRNKAVHSVHYIIHCLVCTVWAWLLMFSEDRCSIRNFEKYGATEHCHNWTIQHCKKLNKFPFLECSLAVFLMQSCLILSFYNSSQVIWRSCFSSCYMLVLYCKINTRILAKNKTFVLHPFYVCCRTFQFNIFRLLNCMVDVLLFSQFLQIVKNWETNKPWLPKKRVDEVRPVRLVKLTDFDWFCAMLIFLVVAYLILGCKWSGESKRLVGGEGSPAEKVCLAVPATSFLSSYLLSGWLQLGIAVPLLTVNLLSHLKKLLTKFWTYKIRLVFLYSII